MDAKFQQNWLVLGLLWIVQNAGGFNYLDYANLFDGEVHLDGAKVTGRASYVSIDGTWKAWEFLGIRYATAERFQAPKFYNDYISDGSDHIVKPFDEPGPACPQSWNGFVYPEVDLNKTNEDCLHLNVHLPPVNHEHISFKVAPWPVLIFVHGGEYQGGAGHLFEGNELAREIDAIIVTFNYRVGPFGFLSTDDYHAKGNWGLKDLIMAVKWIRHYISRFGGDEKRIRLIGYGSGGAMSSLAIADSEIRDTISGLIVMSGSALHPKYIVESPRTAAMDLGNATGCPVDTVDNMMACLSHCSAEEIILADSTLQSRKKPAWFPTIDGDLIPSEPKLIIRHSDWKFAGNILQGFAYMHGQIQVDPTDWPPTQNTIIENRTIASIERDRTQISLLDTRSLVSDMLQCNLTDDGWEHMKQYACFLSGSHGLGGGCAPSTDQLEKLLTEVSCDVKIRLAIYDEAIDIATNRQRHLSDRNKYQLYRLAYDETSFNLSAVNRNNTIDDMIEVALLFGGRLADTVLGGEHDQRSVMTTQMRRLVGIFARHGQAFGPEFSHSDSHAAKPVYNILQLGKSKKWEVTENLSIENLLSFWIQQKRFRCHVSNPLFLH